MDGCGAKQSEIWDMWTPIKHIWGTFDLIGFKDILGSFSAFVLNLPVSQKQLVVEQNRVKFGTRGK